MEKRSQRLHLPILRRTTLLDVQQPGRLPRTLDCPHRQGHEISKMGRTTLGIAGNISDAHRTRRLWSAPHDRRKIPIRSKCGKKPSEKGKVVRFAWLQKATEFPH